MCPTKACLTTNRRGICFCSVQWCYLVCPSVLAWIMLELGCVPFPVLISAGLINAGELPGAGGGGSSGRKVPAWRGGIPAGDGVSSVQRDCVSFGRFHNEAACSALRPSHLHGCPVCVRSGEGSPRLPPCLRPRPVLSCRFLCWLSN